MTQPNEVFISHASEDGADVERLGVVLQRHAIPFWYSDTAIQGAAQWHDEIGDALRRCDWFALLLSPRAVASRWVKHEYLFALRQDEFEGRITPLLLEECDVEQLSWTLSGIQTIDMRGDFADGCRRLLRGWGVGFRPE